MVPVMKGWKEHMYLNVPAVRNTTAAVPPGSMVPASKAPADVAVCGCGSSFFQTTVPPTGTFTSADENLKSAIPTATSLEARALSEQAPIVGKTTVARRIHRYLIAISSEPNANRFGPHWPGPFESSTPRE